MTKYFCDFCNKEASSERPTISLRIDDRMHDVCSDCYSILKKILADSGTPVQDPIYVPGAFPGQGWVQPDVLTNPLIPTPSYPNNGIIMTGTMNAGPTATNVTDISGMITLNTLMTAYKEPLRPSACLMPPEAV